MLFSTEYQFWLALQQHTNDDTMPGQLYDLCTASGANNQNWYSVLNSIDPWFYAMIGPGMALVLSIVGAAWGIFLTGSTIVGASVKTPRIKSKNLSALFSARQLPSTVS
jgi:F0F1-type ATP synthase membrane subunit c/vacuolar-type H+-ATPase subunit K